MLLLRSTAYQNLDQGAFLIDHKLYLEIQLSFQFFHFETCFCLIVNNMN